MIVIIHTDVDVQADLYFVKMLVICCGMLLYANTHSYPHMCLNRLTLSSLQINQAVLGIHGADVQYSGINFLESLVHALYWIS